MAGASSSREPGPARAPGPAPAHRGPGACPGTSRAGRAGRAGALEIGIVLTWCRLYGPTGTGLERRGESGPTTLETRHSTLDAPGSASNGATVLGVLECFCLGRWTAGARRGLAHRACRDWRVSRLSWSQRDWSASTLFPCGIWRGARPERSSASSAPGAGSSSRRLSRPSLESGQEHWRLSPAPTRAGTLGRTDRLREHVAGARGAC